MRPGWDGTPVTPFDEFLFLLQSPMVLILIFASALAVRFRSEWGGVAVVVGWSLATFFVTGWSGTGGTMDAALQEGCVGSASIFITVAVAVGIGVVLYTAPRRARKE